MGYIRWVALMRLIFAVGVLVATIPALAHSWYPLACCGNMDCFPVACDQLVETASGWLYVPTGNLFQREQVQPSQDQHCHVCLGRTGDHRSICAFIVPNALAVLSEIGGRISRALTEAVEAPGFDRKGATG